MKKNTYTVKGPEGVTLIELTVVIAIILLLISILFVGAKYYKDNADRSACIVNINALQKAVRSVQNIKGYTTAVAITETDVVGTTSSVIPVAPKCPTDGATAYALAGANFPAVGTVAYKCQEATIGNKAIDEGGHIPDPTKTTSW